METRYYLAVDIGASSGRHLLVHAEDGRIVPEEIYRFRNDFSEEGGHKVWDTDRLFREILTGMKKCREAGKIPVSMGIDTWAVDYVLLDPDGKRIGPCYAYRDARTEGMDQKVYEVISQEDLYARTGIQKMSFNTIFQLTACREQEPELLNTAGHLLMLPDYFHYLLTGVMKQEYTNATSTQLVSAADRTWDRDLIERLGFPQRLFQDLSMPGTFVGMLKEEIREEAGFDVKVVLPATHDTASAVMSVPSNAENVLYISSGTWSLMGCELDEADTGEDACRANFTNEGGYDFRYRFLKNIMGLWMIQSVKKELDEQASSAEGEREDYSYAGLCRHAASERISSLVDAGDSRFMAPASMIREVRGACAEAGMQVPETPWETARVIYRSLASCYGRTAEEIERLTGRSFDAVHIVGGGANADWLNELTAEFSGKTVYAGPAEATAIGNAGAQMIADGVFGSLPEFRRAVFRSGEIRTYRP